MQMKKRIKRNIIKCKCCGDIIESKSRHEFVECSCGACFVDGGHDYVRCGGSPENIEFLTEYEEVPEYKIKLRFYVFEVTVLGTIEEIKNRYKDNLLEIIDPETDKIVWVTE